MPNLDGHPSPRILLVAEHASAAFGGEALIPFQYFKYLREMQLDVHLLVHARTQNELEQAFPHDLERLHFVADSLINRWCHKISQLLPSRVAVFTTGALSHLETQIRQRRVAKVLVRKYDFDIVHEPIPVSPKLPSMMFGLSAPVIIGPMNGGMEYPPNYNLATLAERLIIAALRSSADIWNMIVPGKHRAALLLVANARTHNALPRKLRTKKIVELVENGVDLDLFKPSTTGARTKNEACRIIFIGRLVDWKRVDLLMLACSRLLGKTRFELDLIGAGPSRVALEQQVEQLSLKEHVRFHGQLSQAAAADLLRRADIMVLPSMYESGGAVVLEAMACAVPVVATRWGGPADYVTSETGILVPPAAPSQYVHELAEAILRLAKSPCTRSEMGTAARRRAAALYDWRVKARALSNIYADIGRTVVHFGQ